MSETLTGIETRNLSIAEFDYWVTKCLKPLQGLKPGWDLLEGRKEVLQNV